MYSFPLLNITMHTKQIWVDADACPKVIKEILFRAADRVGVRMTLVANQPLQVPGSLHILRSRWAPVSTLQTTTSCNR